MKTIKIGFICVHNSCRSQMAEAIAKIKFSQPNFKFYSAGTHIKAKINQDAVDLIKDFYNVDMNLTQKNKLLEDIPALDIVITMGCNVDCPILPCKFREDWGLEDPSNLGRDKFIETHDLILNKLENLVWRIQKNIIQI